MARVVIAHDPTRNAQKTRWRIGCRTCNDRLTWFAYTWQWEHALTLAGAHARHHSA